MSGRNPQRPVTKRIDTLYLDEDVGTSFRTFDAGQQLHSIPSYVDGGVRAMVRTPTGIWCGGRKGQIVIYNAKTKELMAKKTAQPSAAVLSMTSFQLSGSVGRVWVGLSSGAVAVFDEESARQITHIRGHNSGVLCLMALRGEVWTGGADWDIRVFNAKTHTPVLQIHTKNWVTSLIHDKKKDMVWVGQGDKTISVVDPHRHEVVERVRGHSDSVLCLTEAEGVVWTGSADKSVRVWDIDTFRCLKVHRVHTGRVLDIVNAGQLIWSCSADKTIVLFDASTFGVVTTMKASPTGWVGKLSVNSVDNEVWSAGADRYIRVWAVGSLKAASMMQGTISETTDRGLFVSVGKHDSPTAVTHAHIDTERFNELEEELQRVKEELKLKEHAIEQVQSSKLKLLKNFSALRRSLLDAGRDFGDSSHECSDTSDLLDVMETVVGRTRELENALKETYSLLVSESHVVESTDTLDNNDTEVVSATPKLARCAVRVLKQAYESKPQSTTLSDTTDSHDSRMVHLEEIVEKFTQEFGHGSLDDSEDLAVRIESFREKLKSSKEKWDDICDAMGVPVDERPEEIDLTWLLELLGKRDTVDGATGNTESGDVQDDESKWKEFLNNLSTKAQIRVESEGFSNQIDELQKILLVEPGLIKSDPGCFSPSTSYVASVSSPAEQSMSLIPEIHVRVETMLGILLEKRSKRVKRHLDVEPTFKESEEESVDSMTKGDVDGRSAACTSTTDLDSMDSIEGGKEDDTVEEQIDGSMTGDDKSDSEGHEKENGALQNGVIAGTVVAGVVVAGTAAAVLASADDDVKDKQLENGEEDEASKELVEPVISDDGVDPLVTKESSSEGGNTNDDEQVHALLEDSDREECLDNDALPAEEISKGIVAEIIIAGTAAVVRENADEDQVGHANGGVAGCGEVEGEEVSSAEKQDMSGESSNYDQKDEETNLSGALPLLGVVAVGIGECSSLLVEDGSSETGEREDDASPFDETTSDAKASLDPLERFARHLAFVTQLSRRLKEMKKSLESIPQCPVISYIEQLTDVAIEHEISACLLVLSEDISSHRSQLKFLRCMLPYNSDSRLLYNEVSDLLERRWKEFEEYRCNLETQKYLRSRRNSLLRYVKGARQGMHEELIGLLENGSYDFSSCGATAKDTTDRLIKLSMSITPARSECTRWLNGNMAGLDILLNKVWDDETPDEETIFDSEVKNLVTQRILFSQLDDIVVDVGCALNVDELDELKVSTTKLLQGAKVSGSVEQSMCNYVLEQISSRNRELTKDSTFGDKWLQVCEKFLEENSSVMAAGGHGKRSEELTKKYAQLTELCSELESLWESGEARSLSQSLNFPLWSMLHATCCGMFRETVVHLSSQTPKVLRFSNPFDAVLQETNEAQGRQYALAACSLLWPELTRFSLAQLASCFKDRWDPSYQRTLKFYNIRIVGNDEETGSVLYEVDSFSGKLGRFWIDEDTELLESAFTDD